MDATSAPLTDELDPRRHALDLGFQQVAQRRATLISVVPDAQPGNFSEQFVIVTGEAAQLVKHWPGIIGSQVPCAHRRELDIQRGARPPSIVATLPTWLFESATVAGRITYALSMADAQAGLPEAYVIPA